MAAKITYADQPAYNDVQWVFYRIVCKMQVVSPLWELVDVNKYLGLYCLTMSRKQDPRLISYMEDPRLIWVKLIYLLIWDMVSPVL